MDTYDRTTLAVLGIGLVMVSGCEDLVPRDVDSLLIPRFTRSEVMTADSH